MTLWGKGERAIAEILRVLADYPPARGAVVEYAEVLTEFGFHPDAVLRFPLPDGRDAALSNVLDVLPPVAAVTGAPPDRYVLRPRLGELESDAPSLLMTFWALMFGLSQLARYHPEQWVSALDPNTSPVAVDLEQLIDAALELVPELLVPALSHGALSPLEALLAIGQQHLEAQQRNAPVAEGLDEESS